MITKKQSQQQQQKATTTTTITSVETKSINLFTFALICCLFIDFFGYQNVRRNSFLKLVQR